MAAGFPTFLIGGPSTVIIRVPACRVKGGDRIFFAGQRSAGG
jgi:hypothetical protein